MNELKNGVEIYSNITGKKLNQNSRSIARDTADYNIVKMLLRAREIEIFTSKGYGTTSITVNS